MNQYEELVLALIESEDLEVTITSNVTSRALRKGLTKALKAINDANAIMELPTYDYSVSITERAKNKITVALVDPDTAEAAHNKFTSKFQFSIVSNDNDNSEEPT